MPNRYKKEDISKLSDRKIFFDANILIYLFWASIEKPEQKKYSSFFADFLKQKNTLVVNTIVISEFINRAFVRARTNYEKQNGNKKLKPKEFRKTSAGQKALSDISDIVQSKILPYFKLNDMKFTAAQIKQLLTLDKLEFNDRLVAETCKLNNYVLLTNDSDFANADIDTISANRKLLK